MKLGHAYLLRKCTWTGTEVLIAFQCFGAGSTERVLLAWKILEVFRDRNRDRASAIRPFWDWRAWREVFKRPEDRDAALDDW